MKILNIGGKNYTVKFSIEASLYSDCTERVSSLMTRIGDTKSKEDIYEFIKGIADVPRTALDMFYAGLLEEHGVDGDKTILSIKDAKNLVKIYFDEHKNDEKGNFFALMMDLFEVMGDDGFFGLIGLNHVTADMKKGAKKPQDHKKTTKKTAKAAPKVTEN